MSGGEGEHLPGWRLERVDPERMEVLARILGDPNPIHLRAAAAASAGIADRQVNQGPSTMAMAVNMLLAAFPGAHLASLRVRLLAPVLAGDTVEAGGRVTSRETCDGEERVQCRVHAHAGDRGLVLEGEAVLSLRLRPVPFRAAHGGGRSAPSSKTSAIR